MRSKEVHAAVAIVGAGIIGIAVAYYLTHHHGVKNIVLIDPLSPLSLTSAVSGENYRNWWPHPVMTAFTNHSIDLMEEIAGATHNRINMTRRGYALVTRTNASSLIEDLYRGYGTAAEGFIRIHDGKSSYVPALSSAWETAPDGVDVLCNRELIHKTFPTFADDIQTVLHIRRAGSISGQQLGQYMLEVIREAGGRVIQGEVVSVEGTNPFSLVVQSSEETLTVKAEQVVNAAGPFLERVAKLLGEDLPISCVYQQKIAFEDREKVIPRNLPFTIDLDEIRLSWLEEERALLAEDPATQGLLEAMPGGIHCRPDGPKGTWIKLGWAYNDQASDPTQKPPLNPHFPDLVLRAASRLHPALGPYVGHIPKGAHSYGGYYTLTPENWPLIGAMQTEGVFVAGALSGFGTMGACATGALCAAWVVGGTRPAYARVLSPTRYANPTLMTELMSQNSKGIL